MKIATELPALLLFVIALLVYGVFMVLLRFGLRRTLSAEEKEHLSAAATPFMTALGALFAVLTAFTITAEWARLQQAQNALAAEVAADARLGWASTSPGVDSSAIQQRLTNYVDRTLATDWAEEPDTASSPAVAYYDLQRTVRAEATKAEIKTPVANELLASLDALTTARRDRFSVPTQGPPGLLVLLLTLSGFALLANAVAISLKHESRPALVSIGLVVIVSMTLTLVAALAAPFSGSVQVSRAPLENVLKDLREHRIG